MRLRNWNAPSERVVTMRPRGSWGPAIVTCTPGSGAPLLSRATPLTDPVVCAIARDVRSRPRTETTREERSRIPSPCDPYKKNFEARIERILHFFEPSQVLEGLTAANEPCDAVLDEDF